MIRLIDWLPRKRVSGQPLLSGNFKKRHQSDGLILPVSLEGQI